MYDVLDKWLLEHMDDGLAYASVSGILKLIIAALIATVIYFILRVINTLMFSKSKVELLKKMSSLAFEKRTMFLTGVFMFFALIYEAFPKISTIGSIITLMVLLCSVVDIINALYQTKEISRQRPIKGILSVVKVAICILFAIILI